MLFRVSWTESTICTGAVELSDEKVALSKENPDYLENLICEMIEAGDIAYDEDDTYIESIDVSPVE